MDNMSKASTSVEADRRIGVLAILIGIISAIGFVLLIIMYVLFARSQMALGQQFGMFNDILIGLQYLLTIPVALALYRMLKAYNPALMRIATIVGVIAMLVVVALQLLLVTKVLTFEQQVPWVSLAMLLGVGFWLIATGLVARSVKWLPNSLLMSIIAVLYFGFPIWAFWLGRHLLKR